MKTLIQLTMVVGLLLLTGCVGPWYGSKKQYDSGNWHFLANNRDVQQRSQQQLAMEKLQAQPVITGTMTATGVVANPVASGKTASAGYKGIVVNNSSSRSYSFSIRGEVGGIEDKDYYLGPGQRALDEECYLLPGKYTVTIHDGGYQIGRPQVIDVGPRIKLFQNEKCHWYAVAKW